MTIPDTGPERPGGLASDTREMAELDRMDRIEGEGPRGRVVGIVALLIVIAVTVFLIVR